MEMCLEINGSFNFAVHGDCTSTNNFNDAEENQSRVELVAIWTESQQPVDLMQPIELAESISREIVDPLPDFLSNSIVEDNFGSVTINNQGLMNNDFLDLSEMSFSSQVQICFEEPLSEADISGVGILQSTHILPVNGERNDSQGNFVSQLLLTSDLTEHNLIQ